MREPQFRPDAADLTGLGRTIDAITLDFGNTLVPFPGSSRNAVLDETAESAARAWGMDATEFSRVWGEERVRQFAEDVPAGREADMEVRAARVLARLRGCPEPPDGARWEEAAVSRWSSPDEVQAVLDAYASAFVRLTPVPPEIGPMLERLAGRFSLAILSNWPIATAIERFVDAAGWRPHLNAVVVSQRVGVIKPWPEIFRVTAEALGVASGNRLLHVGDDLGADVAGAHGVGWRAGWVRLKPEDSPLPVAPPGRDEVPDLTIDRVTDLPGALGFAGGGLPGQPRRPRPSGG